MQTFNLVLNETVKADIGVDILNPIIKIEINKVTYGEILVFDYIFSFYINQEQYNADNPFVLDSLSKKGGQIKKMLGRVSANDFICESDSSFNLTDSSLNSFKDRVKTLLATALSVDENKIS